MKKTVSLLMSLLLACGSGAALAGCGNKKGNGAATEGCLTIRYFQGGYGDEWLKDSLTNFLTEKLGRAPVKNEDYKLIPDEQVTQNQENYLKGSNVPDILMTQGGYDAYIERGLIENLTDVYEMSVEKLDGTKVKIKDYMLPQAYQSVTRQMKYGTNSSVHSWVIPWQAQSFSLAYNEDLLFDTVHTESAYSVADDIDVGQKWTRTPETVNELLAYFADVEAGTSGKIPFGWSYKAGLHLQFLVDVWWAQIQGTTTSKIDGEGSFYDFFNFNDLDLLDQTGIQMGFDTLRSLMLDKPGEKGAKYINSDTEKNLGSISTAQYNLNAAAGAYAVWVAGDYFENESIKPFSEEPSFTTKMMFVPNAIGADGQQTTEKLTYIRTDESFYVPVNAVNKDLAKEFLAYMCNEAELLNYTKKCGGLRPFSYDPLALAPDYNWTEFQKSFFNTYNNADEIIIEFPANVEDPKDISPVYLYNKNAIHFFLNASFTTLFSKANETVSAKKIMTDFKENVGAGLFKTWEKKYKPYFNSL